MAANKANGASTTPAVAREVAPLPGASPWRRRIILIAGALALVSFGGLFGFGVAYLAGAFSSGDASAVAAGESGHGEATPPSEERGGGHGGGDGGEQPAATPKNPDELTLVPLGNGFTVNLRGTGGARVLRITISVETREEHADTVRAATDKLRSEVIMVVTDYNYRDLEGAEGKMRLRDDLIRKLNDVLGGYMIERIYFTEFVIQ